VTDWLGGEVHLFAVAVEPVMIDARDAQGYEVKTKSFFDGTLAAGMVANWGGAESDSSVMQTRSGDKVKAIVPGTSCTLVVALRKP